MPPGVVSNPKTKDGFLKSGYLGRYDLYDDNGMPSKIPVLNAQDLEIGTPVVFDVVQATINEGGNAYFIPVAVVREDVLEMDWEKEWKKADEESQKIEIKEDDIVLNDSNQDDWRGKVKGKIGRLGKNKPEKNPAKKGYLKQIHKA